MQYKVLNFNKIFVEMLSPPLSSCRSPVTLMTVFPAGHRVFGLP